MVLLSLQTRRKQATTGLSHQVCFVRNAGADKTGTRRSLTYESKSPIEQGKKFLSFTSVICYPVRTSIPYIDLLADMQHLLASPSLTDVPLGSPSENAPLRNFSKIQPDFLLEDIASERCKEISMPSWPSQEEIPCLASLFDGSSGQHCPVERLLDSLLDVDLCTDLLPMPNVLNERKTKTQRAPVPPVFFSGTIQCQDIVTPIDVPNINTSNTFESDTGKAAKRLRQQLVGFAFFENQYVMSAAPYDCLVYSLMDSSPLQSDTISFRYCP